MKIYAINGGPRKTWNTMSMLSSFLEGVTSSGEPIETEIIHLFDYSYKGCISCFQCKENAETYGHCNIKDDLSNILKKVSLADGIVIGSPIYYHNMTGQLRAFLERLLFPYDSFKKGEGYIAPKHMPIAVIYTMNVEEEEMRREGYDVNLSGIEKTLGNIFCGDAFPSPEIIYAFNTYEFKDYSQYKADYWDEKAKAEHRKTQFPIDCQKAFNAGKNMFMCIKNLE